MFRGLAVALCLLGSSGCVASNYCNGTGEPLRFGYGINGPDFENEFQIEPCSCERVVLLSGRGVEVTSVRDLSGNVLAVDHTVHGPTVVYDGFELYENDQIVDMTVKFAITFRNESSEAVHVKPLPAAFRPQTLLEPGESREIITVRTGLAEFHASNADGTQELASCEAEIVDGLEIIWDSENLVWGVAPPPPADIVVELCNTDAQTNAPAVILVTADEDVLPEKNVIAGECRSVTVPTESPVTFEAWDNEAVLLLDTCTLADPSAGDQVTWNGFELTCVDVASTARSAGITTSEPDPIEETAVEALRLGNDLLRSLRREVGRWLD